MTSDWSDMDLWIGNFRHLPNVRPENIMSHEIKGGGTSVTSPPLSQPICVRLSTLVFSEILNKCH
jgi:hypothetical protein